MNKLMPTTWLLVSLLTTLALRLVISGPQMVSVPWNMLGLLLVAFDIWINLAADRAIHRAHKTVRPFEEPSALIAGSA